VSHVTSESTEKIDPRVRIGRHEGSRDDLRELFELAEDSAVQLNSYIDEGDVYVAEAAGAGVIGHLQLVTRDAAAGEIKNMAVAGAFQRRGVGTALVHRAIDVSHRNGWRQLFVRTATADTGNLRFYQRLGFRCITVEPDAFTSARGYPNVVLIDKIRLRDAIVLCLTLVESGQAPATMTRSGLKVRVARQSGDLETVVAFYRDGLGLPEIERFTGHAGYDGVLLDLPGTGAHLEFTATERISPPSPHIEDLLVLFLDTREAVDQMLVRLDVTPVPSANPYWDRVGVTVLDPEGFRVVLVSA
jgi:GNAT superfamily N-acetyltransferase/catechol 2,3-dioxygenase-like lactoylglutathione lyase family enzyme